MLIIIDCDANDVDLYIKERTAEATASQQEKETEKTSWYNFSVLLSRFINIQHVLVCAADDDASKRDQFSFIVVVVVCYYDDDAN